MKNTSNNQDSTVFKYHFTPLMRVIAYASLLLCVVGVGLSIWRLTHEGVQNFTDILKYPFLIAISLFGIALVIALLVRSQYIVKDGQLVLQFGFIKSKYPLNAVTSLLLDTDTKKITVYMGEDFFILTTHPTLNNDLVQAIRKENPDVEFSFTLSETQDKNNK